MRQAWSHGVFLTAAVVVAGVLAAWPAWLLAGAKGWEGLLWAGLICLVPGWLALLAAGGMQAAGKPLAGLLAAMGLRMAVTLALTVAVAVLRRDLGLKEFFIWLLLFYGITLAVETRALLEQSRPKRTASE